ncbi:MAG: MBG domain-containing protein, partial [Bacilli bacterium]|nr:MBG domain-containing protein [Bacilli bacterium]
MRRNKKKIIAMLLFIFMSLFMFAFANPDGEIELEQLKPTITIDENNIYEIEVFSEIPEFKANALDAFGNDLDVEIDHDINNEIVGKYKVTFTAIDSYDNKDEIERDFSVVDTTRPVIRLIGNANYKRLAVYESYTDEGANVTDNYDPDIRINGVVRGNTELPGTYTLRYNHTDANDNRAIERVRSIKILDWYEDEDGDGYSNLEEYNEDTDYDDPLDYPDYDKVPSITLNESNIYSIEVYTDIPEFKATATDVADGDVPVIITHNINKDVIGTYQVTFKATDSLDNTVQIVRDFKVTKIKLTVKADDKTSIYGNSLEWLTHSVISGVLHGTDSLNIGLSKPSGLDVGTYPITITESAENPNYDITLVNGTYTITPKELTEADLGEFSFIDKTVKYNGEVHKIEVEGLPSWASVSYDNNERTSVGTLVVIATITGNSNYSGTIEKTATLTITQAKLVLMAHPVIAQYKDEIKPLNYSVLGVVYGSDNLNVVLSTTATPT